MDYKCGRFENFTGKRSRSRSSVGARKNDAVNKQQQRVDSSSRDRGSITCSPPSHNFFHALLMYTYETVLELTRCLLSIVICQEKQPSTRTSRSSTYSRHPEYFLQSQQQTQRPLYSSDEEGDDDDDGPLRNDPPVPVDLIDDHEIPFVRLFDYFVHLLSLVKKTNYSFSAFIYEARKSVESWGTSDGQSSSNQSLKFNVPRKRPKIVKFAVDALKKRTFKRRMSRVVLNDHKKWLLQWALASRVIIFFMQALTTNLFQVFKHENDGFKFTPEEDYGKLLDPFVNSTFGGYVNWDANYFLHISVNGYTSENIMAFFPLLPMALYIPSRIAYALMGSLISLSSIVIVLGVVFNTLMFVMCADSIYELAKIWSKGSQQLITAAVLFVVFNPASIFFSGLYTETLFLYLTSQVILSLFNRKYWDSVIFAALSGLCRSNGILNFGLIVAFSLQHHLLAERRGLAAWAFSSLLQVLLCSIPFLLFQVYGILRFCEKYAIYDAADISQIPAYCMRTLTEIPVLPYSYVQSKYWDVGFMRYFQVKQIPNFILASPVLFILGKESITALIATLLQMNTNWTWYGLYFALQAAHGIFLTLFCFFFVHVQVSTRMIMAACPYLYIYMADSYLLEVERFRKSEVDLPIRSQIVMLWCALYFIIGTIAFSLGLPWT